MYKVTKPLLYTDLLKLFTVNILCGAKQIYIFGQFDKEAVVFIGCDVIAQAQSGTGKTATFAISILQQIDVELKDVQALVLAPTRELAQQVGSLSNN